jgi:histone-arginine methyltransferase CARM1
LATIVVIHPFFQIAFWNNSNFYGVDLTSVLEKAQKEYFSQAVVGMYQIYAVVVLNLWVHRFVGNFSPSILISSQRTMQSIDFQAVSCEELQDFEIPFQFRIDKTAIMHGLGGWFDIEFNGSGSTVVLSTAPEKPTTHWYQCRMMFSQPIGVNRGQTVSGSLRFRANEKFSYFIDVTARIDGTNVTTSNTINLHDQMYHYLQAAATNY